MVLGRERGQSSRRRRQRKEGSSLTRTLHPYKEGDKVSIVLDGSQQKGMPHRRFHGLTGSIVKPQGKAFVVSVVQGNMQKTVVARPEHLRPA